MLTKYLANIQYVHSRYTGKFTNYVAFYAAYILSLGS